MRLGGSNLRDIQWKVLRSLHTFDYAVLLPGMARLHLSLAYWFSALRGTLNGWIGRDWRSMGMGTRHVARRSAIGFRTLLPGVSDEELRALVRERFETESREEFEGRLIVAQRAAELRCKIFPDGFLHACLNRDRGLVLLTPHFDSFILGVVFLGQAGVRVNLMSSLGDGNSGINPAVFHHFVTKYQAMESYMNGGRVVPMEDGLRHFYQMLERKECLVILADIPPSANTARVSPSFLGARRSLAGGALRMARKTHSDLGAFVCNFDSPGRYRVMGSTILDAAAPQALDAAYQFMTDAITVAPGRWWAADLLPEMPAVEDPKENAGTGPDRT